MIQRALLSSTSPWTAGSSHTIVDRAHSGNAISGFSIRCSRRRHRSRQVPEQREGHPEQEQEGRHGADQRVLEHVGRQEPLLGDPPERRADGREDQGEAGIEGRRRTAETSPKRRVRPQ